MPQLADVIEIPDSDEDLTADVSLATQVPVDVDMERRNPLKKRKRARDSLGSMPPDE